MNDTEQREVVVRRIVIPTGDVMRLALQWCAALVVIGIFVKLLNLLLEATTAKTLMDFLF